ncbi:MAG TPA: glycosyltransferase family 4 protein, partial [Bryobacteraceae bacterium]|nr:glycosyltransferase family 4 protein [Bryobacteraceae bacterium]
LAAESGTNHIHCHWAGTTATMAMLAAEIAGVPWSFTAHRSDIAGNNLLAEKVRSARFARVISHSGVQMMMARGVPASPKIRVLHLGVRLPSVPPQPAVARPPVVLCPADFLPVKGHRYLMDAWRIFESRGMAGELWLVGRGDARSVIEKPPANVKVVGELNNPALLDLYRTGAIAATVLASIDLGNGEHEGIPAALMEAMSFAVPVVATNTGGIPELVTRGSGLLVREKNPAALADAIAAVVGNPELAAQLGRAGRRRVAEAFDVTEIASQLEGWFEATCPTTQNNQRDRSLTLPAQKRTC